MLYDGKHFRGPSVDDIFEYKLLFRQVKNV